MQQLIKHTPKMSSKRIAEKTGKLHKNVVRDINAMLEELQKDGSNLSHDDSNLNDSEYQVITDNRGYTSEIFLNERLTLCLATGYSVKLRMAIIDDWAAMKSREPSSEDTNYPLLPHTKRPVQIDNAKSANHTSFVQAGKVGCMDWNRKVSFSFTGFLPHELKEWAKRKGVPAKFRTSGKEVIRYFRPAKAAAISLADYLHAKGVEDKEAIELAKGALPALAKIAELERLKS